MAVVAGVVFFAVRALLALIPGPTVSAPIKKWSAASSCMSAAREVEQQCGPNTVAVVTRWFL
jgi:hypothetical protein